MLKKSKPKTRSFWAKLNIISWANRNNYSKKTDGGIKEKYSWQWCKVSKSMYMQFLWTHPTPQNDFKKDGM